MPVLKKKKLTKAKKSITTADPMKRKKLGKKFKTMIIGAATTAILGTGLYANAQRIKKSQKEKQEQEQALKRLKWKDIFTKVLKRVKEEKAEAKEKARKEEEALKEKARKEEKALKERAEYYKKLPLFLPSNNTRLPSYVYQDEHQFDFS